MKVITKPKGKAGEYAKYAVNFYKGCSNGCEYCYLKRGVLSKTLGGNAPTLLKKYKNETDAFGKFCDDLDLFSMEKEFLKHGFFFTFSSDPLLPETYWLNLQAIRYAVSTGFNCTLLTKRADNIEHVLEIIPEEHRGKVAVGFTLTGHNELEPHASSNMDRIDAMRKLHRAGFKTWASIEPIIDVQSSLHMIYQTFGICDHYKVGLRSGVGKNYYKDEELVWFYNEMKGFVERTGKPVYLKGSFRKRLGTRYDLDHLGSYFDAPKGLFVNADFNLFER